jgi:hypothetical protein
MVETGRVLKSTPNTDQMEGPSQVQASPLLYEGFKFEITSMQNKDRAQ